MHILLLAGLIVLLGQTPLHATEQRVYSVGIVPQFEVKRTHEIWRPILDALEQRTGLRFQLVGSPTISAFDGEFRSGRFDFAYANPYHVMLAQQSEGYTPLVRDTARRLYGVVVARKDSGINQMTDLAGQSIVFPDPNALGATLLVKQELINRLHLQVNPRYVKTHDSVYLNVALGLAAAGGGVQKTLNQQNDEIKSLLKIIHKTVDVAPHPLVVHPRVEPQVAEAVKQALLALGATAEGRALFSAVPIHQIGPASIDDYKPLAEMNLQQFYLGNP